MALLPDQKFSTFQDGGTLEVGDIVVGLRDGLNTRFDYTGELPPGVVVPIVQGGTGATTAGGARTNLGLGTMAIQDANSVAITGGTAALASGSVTAAPTSDTDLANKKYVDDLDDGNVKSVSGTANEIDVDNTDAANPVLSLSATLNFPGTFTVQNSTILDGIIDDDTFATATGSNISTSEATKAYIDGLDSGNVKSVSGTANEVDVDNTDSQNPIVGLSDTIDAPGTFTIQGSSVINKIINDDTMATAGTDNISTSTAMKNYVDNKVGGSVTSITGTPNQIIASSSTGAVVLSTPQDIAAASTPSFAGMTLTAALNMSSQLINNVLDPVSNQDAATKKYVDDTAVPGGNDTQVQYNNSGSFAGDPNFTTNGSGNVVMSRLQFIPTNSGFLGTPTNDNALAGIAGEFRDSETLVSITSATITNIVSLTLSAGDWEVWGGGVSIPAGGATLTSFQLWVNDASATPPDMSKRFFWTGSTGGNIGGGATRRRFSFASTTTIYLSANLVFSSGTMEVEGVIYGRRAR